jgi:hypothetical protein
MKAPKKQHYVARLYLRRFAIEPAAKSPRVHVFDKSTSKAFCTSVREVAAENYFYERELAGAVEGTFQRLEDMFVAPYQRLLRGDAPSTLSPEERTVVALFVAAQQVRTREMRASMASMLDGLKRRLGEADDRFRHLTDYDEETLRRQQLHSLPSLCQRLSPIIARLKWVLITNGTPRPYWTSDHPVSLYNPRPTDGLTGNLGWACRGIQVFFPLSPVRLLCFCDPIDYASTHEVVTTHDVQTVVFQNHLLIQQSTRYLVSNAADFSFARKVLAEQPEHADPNRQRSEVH